MIRLGFAILVFLGACAALASFHLNPTLTLVLAVATAVSLFFLTSSK